MQNFSISWRIGTEIGPLNSTKALTDADNAIIDIRNKDSTIRLALALGGVTYILLP